MFEAVGPIRGLVFFGLGLVFGSFSSMLRHRLPRRMSWLGPRSMCYRCRHPLSPLDLVPVLSYILLRGRCRHCSVGIPWRYLLTEVGCGTAAGLAAWLGSWELGAAVVLVWVSATVLLAYRKRQPAEAGTTLVEVLIALGLLGGVLIPMLDFGANMRGGTAFQRQMAVSLATSKLEELAGRAHKSANASWPSSGWDQIPVGTYYFDLDWTVSSFVPTNNDYSAEASFLRTATVTVTCSAGCPRPMPPVRMVTVLGKIQQ